MGKAYYLCCRVVWKEARAHSRLPLFKGLTSSSASHSGVVLLVFRFWFHEDFDSMKIFIPWSCLPSKCRYVWTRAQWDPGRWREVSVWSYLGWRQARSSPISVKSASSLARVTAVSTWRWTSDLLPGPWGPLFFSAEIGECAMSHHHNRHTTDCAGISFSPLILQWKLACRGPPANTRGATSHPVFCEGSLVFHSHPPSPFLCSSDNILVNS